MGNAWLELLGLEAVRDGICELGEQRRTVMVDSHGVIVGLGVEFVTGKGLDAVDEGARRGGEVFHKEGLGWIKGFGILLE